MSEKEKTIVLLRQILTNATEEEMEGFYKSHPFDSDDDMFLAVLAAAMPDLSPDRLSKDWGISLDAAAWICDEVNVGRVLLNELDENAALPGEGGQEE